MICAVSASASGESESVVELSFPPPQPGRRSSSSGPRGADDEEGNAGRPLGEMVDEVEQPVVGPVKILEDEHERALLRQPLEVPAPGREALVRRSSAPRLRRGR